MIVLFKSIHFASIQFAFYSTIKWFQMRAGALYVKLCCEYVFTATLQITWQWSNFDIFIHASCSGRRVVG